MSSPAPVITMGYSSVVVSVLALVGVVCASVGDNALDAGDRIVFVAPVLAPPRDSRTHATDRARQFPILVLLAPQNPSQNVREHEPKSLGRNPQPIYVKKLEDQVRQEPSLNRQKRHLHKLLGKSWGGGGGYSYGGGYGGGHGGGYGGGYPSGGHYQEPTKTIVVHVIKEQGYGGGHHGGGGYEGGYEQGGGGYQHGGGGYQHGGGGYQHGGGGYQHGGGGYQPTPIYQSSGCGGGCGGGGGGYGSSHATASATATATASAQSSGSSGYRKR